MPLRSQGKGCAGKLEPSSDFEEIVQAQAETADAVARPARREVFPFAGISDIGGSLKRLEIGSSLVSMSSWPSAFF